MDADERIHWEHVVKDLGIPPDLQAEIEERARQQDLAPWDFLVAVLWPDEDARPDQRLSA